MNHRIAARLRRLAASSVAASVLLAFCLNLAVLPCAMALGLDDHDCPHCPPADEHSMAGHAGHAVGHETTHETELRPDCVTLTASCSDAAAMNHDGRAPQHQLQNQGSDQPVAGPVSAVDLPTTAYALTTCADPPDPPGPFVPRHILFCVYLD